jgi:hypothetical protein
MDRGQSIGTKPNQILPPNSWKELLVGGEPAITITLKPTEIANVPAEIQGITNRPLINKPSIVTDTRLAI